MGLGTVELVMAVEETFGISIPDKQAQRCVTVEDLHRAVMAEVVAGRVKGSERKCYRCRYALRGRASDTCPECGRANPLTEQLVVETTSYQYLVSIIAWQTALDPTAIRRDDRLVKDLGID